jgi:hypothetical protein
MEISQTRSGVMAVSLIGCDHTFFLQIPQHLLTISAAERGTMAL